MFHYARDKMLSHNFSMLLLEVSDSLTLDKRSRDSLIVVITFLLDDMFRVSIVTAKYPVSTSVIGKDYWLGI